MGGSGYLLSGMTGSRSFSLLESNLVRAVVVVCSFSPKFTTVLAMEFGLNRVCSSLEPLADGLNELVCVGWPLPKRFGIVFGRPVVVVVVVVVGDGTNCDGDGRNLVGCWAALVAKPPEKSCAFWLDGKNGGSMSNDGGLGVLFSATVGLMSFSKTASFCVRRLS